MLLYKKRVIVKQKLTRLVLVDRNGLASKCEGNESKLAMFYSAGLQTTIFDSDHMHWNHLTRDMTRSKFRDGSC